LESRSYNKSHPNPKAYCFYKIDEPKHFLIAWNLCLTFLSTVGVSFTPNQVYSLVPSIIKSYRSGFVSTCRQPFHTNSTLVSANLTQYPSRCSLTFKPCRHDLIMPSCIHPARSSKRILALIAPMIDSIWNLRKPFDTGI
jgi:hypothetical protein